MNSQVAIDVINESQQRGEILTRATLTVLGIDTTRSDWNVVNLGVSSGIQSAIEVLRKKGLLKDSI